MIVKLVWGLLLRWLRIRLAYLFDLNGGVVTNPVGIDRLRIRANRRLRISRGDRPGLDWRLGVMHNITVLLDLASGRYRRLYSTRCNRLVLGRSPGVIFIRAAQLRLRLPGGLRTAAGDGGALDRRSGVQSVRSV